MGAFTEIGEYVSGAVGHCTVPTNHDAVCASDVIGLLRETAGLAEAATSVATECQLSEAERLFLASDEVEMPKAAAPVPASTNFMTMGLAALLPVAAALSFVAGRRMAKGQRAM